MKRQVCSEIDIKQILKNDPKLVEDFLKIALNRIEEYNLRNIEQNEKFKTDGDVQANEEKLAFAYHQIHLLHNQLMDYQIWLKKSQEDLDFMKQAYSDLVNSTCWKITAPLRSLMGGRRGGAQQVIPEKEFPQKQEASCTQEKKCSLTIAKEGQVYDCRVSVVIPTYNAGNDFSNLIYSLKSQKGIKEIEIVIVDSGSSDATLEVAEKAGAVVYEIPNEKFSHSFARNLGAEKSTGEYVLFMVQDAMPTDEYWLYHMITPLLKYKLGAVSCVETPRKDVDLKYCVDMMLHNKFVEASQGDRIMELPDSENYYTLRSNAQLSDIACIFPKKTFMKYKLRGEYAEDLDIGIRLIKDGYRLALLSSVKVVHSHNRSASYGLRRAVVDTTWLNKLFVDFPKEQVGYNDLLATIIDGYAKINSIVEYISDYDKSTKIEEVEEDILKYIKDVFESPQILSTKYISSDRYADKVIKDFLGEIEYIALASDYAKANVLYKEATIDYLKNGIFYYLYQNYNSIPKEVLVDVAQAIYKRFFWEIGMKLAHYIITAPYRDRLYDIAEELKKGI